MSSPDYAAEQFLIELFQTNSVLRGKPITHHEAQAKAKADSIVVQATAGPRELEGPQGYRVNVTAEYRAGGKPAAHNDAINRAMLETIAGTSRAVLDGKWEIWILNEDSSGDRPESDNLRKRSIEVPMILVRL